MKAKPAKKTVKTPMVKVKGTKTIKKTSKLTPEDVDAMFGDDLGTTN